MRCTENKARFNDIQFEVGKKGDGGLRNKLLESTTLIASPSPQTPSVSEIVTNLFDNDTPSSEITDPQARQRMFENATNANKTLRSVHEESQSDSDSDDELLESKESVEQDEDNSGHGKKRKRGGGGVKKKSSNSATKLPATPTRTLPTRTAKRDLNYGEMNDPGLNKPKKKQKPTTSPKKGSRNNNKNSGKRNKSLPPIPQSPDTIDEDGF